MRIFSIAYWRRFKVRAFLAKLVLRAMGYKIEWSRAEMKAIRKYGGEK